MVNTPFVVVEDLVIDPDALISAKETGDSDNTATLCAFTVRESGDDEECLAKVASLAIAA